MKILITSGGCKVPIDDVRHIGNFSSGRYGREIAEAFLDAGHEVIFFHEKGSAVPYCNKWGDRYNKIQKFVYKDYYEYLQVKNLIVLHEPDVIISAAAISDYVMKEQVKGKISSNDDELILVLKKGEKVIKSFRERAPNAIIFGFKLLVEPTYDQITEAVHKVLNAGVDYVIYNDLADLKQGDAVRELYRRGPKGEVQFSGNINVPLDLVNLTQRIYDSKISHSYRSKD
jgi:phosphopantothenoylcysteine synthetase/decarboxylase